MPESIQSARGFAEMNGAKLYYEVTGAGHSLVLLHEGIADSRMYDDQFNAFAQHYRVVRFDIRGFGQSDLPGDKPTHISLRYIFGIGPSTALELCEKTRVDRPAHPAAPRPQAEEAGHLADASRDAAAEEHRRQRLALEPGEIEQPHEVRIPLGHLENPGGDRRERLPQRRPLHLRRQELPGLSDALLDDGFLNRPLVGEVLEDQRLAHARGLGHVPAPGPAEAGFGEGLPTKIFDPG